MNDDSKREKRKGEEATAKTFRSGARVKQIETNQATEQALKIVAGPDQAEAAPTRISSRGAGDQQSQSDKDAVRSGAKLKRYETSELVEEADDFDSGPDQVV